MSYIFWFFMLLANFQCCYLFPEQGKWDFHFDQDQNVAGVAKSLFKGSKIYMHVTCYPDEKSHDEIDALAGEKILPVNILLEWVLSESPCWEDFLSIGYGNVGKLQLDNLLEKNNSSGFSHVRQPEKTFSCSDHIDLDELHFSELGKAAVQQMTPDTHNDGHPQLNDVHTSKQPIFTITKDGIYILVVRIRPENNRDKFNVSAHIEMKADYGYISAAEWPLLPFYGGMCLVYLIFGISWQVVLFMQWKDLLRIQFWIGGVIALGMLEKAVFYAEYQSINSTGKSAMPGAVFFAELVSCAKRTLARTLVIVVSLGFGIVKPRLGSHLHRVILVGVGYLILASWEAYLRVMVPRSDVTGDLFMAGVPLAILDSFICWWIFSSLVQTIRTLRLRRNLVKLTLYNHFTNTLIFAVIGSVLFMLYSIKTHRITSCLTNWKDLWLDDAFWHLLFSIILFVIMILWRPTNNNQRYAFSPLLDLGDDDDDEEIEHFVNDAYGVKMRGIVSNNQKLESVVIAPSDKDRLLESQIEWVDDNLPPSIIDSALPMFDSDEDEESTKFEISKML